MSEPKVSFQDIANGVQTATDMYRAASGLIGMLTAEEPGDELEQKIQVLLTAFLRSACKRDEEQDRRIQNLETRLGQAQARISVLEKAAERAAGE